MKWYNAQRDPLPDHEQQVLISVNGVYYITVFDAGEKIFRLRDQPDASFSAEDYLIYWTEFTDA